ncbi:MOSC domain-containing protein [bacterium]|nr:MOSC domain-containing protein [bacterium]
MSTLVQILIAKSPKDEMQSLTEACLIAGRGIEGDRYYLGCGTFSPNPPKPDFEITLIEQEQVDAFAKASGLAFTAAQARRNLVTTGVDLNALVGCEFNVGEIRLRGIRLCEPCQHLAKISFPETLNGLVHRAGLRAQILSSGTIRVGDVINTNG